MSDDYIGKVTATENKPTSCNTVRFWVKDDIVIRPFDIVKIENVRSSFSYAIVKDLEYMTDSSGHLNNYISSDFGDVSLRPFNKRIGTTVAEAEILYNSENIEMPIKDGVGVEWADKDGIMEALGLRNVKRPIPAGYITQSNNLKIPIVLEREYLLGPQAAHLNIAGISGLATKTSYVLFLLSAIQQMSGKDPSGKDLVKTILFNVKGTDLLHIDEDPIPQLTSEQLDEWAKCELEPKPFKNVHYLYPFSKNERQNFNQSHIEQGSYKRQCDSNIAFNYYYGIETALQNLEMLISDIDDTTATMDSIINKFKGEIDKIDNWDVFHDRLGHRIQSGVQGDKEIAVQSWRKFTRLMRSRTINDIFTEKAVVHPEKKRHKQIKEKLMELQPGEVLVIDIEPLPSYLQSFIVGDVVRTLYGMKQGEYEEYDQESNTCKIIVFADELNKYAPKGSTTGQALTGNLLEITERGRSLGVLLFGAEQFRSGVHERILGNCGTDVFGRTSPVEVEKGSDYRYFPKTYKSAVQRLDKGQLLLQHPIFKTALVKLRFPIPAYFQPKGD